MWFIESIIKEVGNINGIGIKIICYSSWCYCNDCFLFIVIVIGIGEGIGDYVFVFVSGSWIEVVCYVVVVIGYVIVVVYIICWYIVV